MREVYLAIVNKVHIFTERWRKRNIIHGKRYGWQQNKR